MGNDAETPELNGATSTQLVSSDLRPTLIRTVFAVRIYPLRNRGGVGFIIG
jgi:hypothetical protein